MFANLDWPEWTVGLILLVISLVTLCGCLVLMVKILNSMFNGPVANLMKTVVNAEFPGVFRHFTGYVAILVRAWSSPDPCCPFSVISFILDSSLVAS